VDGLAGPVEFGLVSGGRSNLTYRLTDAAGATYALRRPPTGGVLSTAHDVSREWRFISALAPTAVPVARPVAYCADTAVTGAEFYVMRFVEGLVLADADAGLALVPQARSRAAEQLVDVLVALHALDPVALGLGDMDPGGLFATRRARCSIWAVLVAMIRPAAAPSPLVPAAEWMCHVHAACPLAGAGSADRRGDRGNVRVPEDGAAAGGGGPGPAGPVAGR
jgi:aminoglycoside phosphotransferase (APT) family kinase protein